MLSNRNSLSLSFHFFLLPSYLSLSLSVNSIGVAEKDLFLFHRSQVVFSLATARWREKKERD